MFLIRKLAFVSSLIAVVKELYIDTLVQSVLFVNRVVGPVGGLIQEILSTLAICI